MIPSSEQTKVDLTLRTGRGGLQGNKANEAKNSLVEANICLYHMLPDKAKGVFAALLFDFLFSLGFRWVEEVTDEDTKQKIRKKKAHKREKKRKYREYAEHEFPELVGKIRKSMGEEQWRRAALNGGGGIYCMLMHIPEVLRAKHRWVRQEIDLQGEKHWVEVTKEEVMAEQFKDIVPRILVVPENPRLLFDLMDEMVPFSSKSASVHAHLRDQRDEVNSVAGAPPSDAMEAEAGVAQAPSFKAMETEVKHGRDSLNDKFGHLRESGASSLPGHNVDQLNDDILKYDQKIAPAGGRGTQESTSENLQDHSEGLENFDTSVARAPPLDATDTEAEIETGPADVAPPAKRLKTGEDDAARPFIERTAALHEHASLQPPQYINRPSEEDIRHDQDAMQVGERAAHESVVEQRQGGLQDEGAWIRLTN